MKGHTLIQSGKLEGHDFFRKNSKIPVTVTSEDVCWNIRNVKINEEFYNMRCLVMFITAVCLPFKSRLEIQKRVFSRVGAKILNEMPASLRELPKKTLFDILKKHDDCIDISQITSALKAYK